jgi:hypothetical protein
MVAVRGRPLFKKYIKNLYGDDVTEEKISIDFNDFNVFY